MIPLRDDNPTTIKPIMTVGLIALNILVSIYQISLGPQGGQVFVYQFGAIPAVIFGDAFDFTRADFTSWCKEVGFKTTNIIPLGGPASAAVAFK